MNTSDSDHKLEAAWRAASRDEPPAALDDTIRAAARRAVGAGPRRARHLRSWPLAAAAVMAVFAIGLLQLTPPEQVTPAMVAENSPPIQEAKEAAKPAGADAASRNAPAAGPAKQDAPIAIAASPDASVAAPANIDRPADLARKKLAQVPAVMPPPTSAPERDQARGDAASINTEKLRQLDAKAKPESGIAQQDAQASAKVRAEPFPAATQEKLVAAAPAASAPAAPPPALASMARPAPAPAEAAGALSERREAAPAPQRAALAKDAAPRPADEWIKLIRKLRSEGRNDEAAKELTAFRAAYKDGADALLPPDLRVLKP